MEKRSLINSFRELDARQAKLQREAIVLNIILGGIVGAGILGVLWAIKQGAF